MKRRIRPAAIILALVLALSLCGCESSTATESPPAPSPDVTLTLIATPSPSIEPSPTPESNTYTNVYNYENGMGYAFSVTVKIWDPIKNAEAGVTTHPGDYEDILQSTLFDPTTELVIPAQFIVENTTQNFNVYAGVSATVLDIAENSYYPPNADVAVEGFYSSGPSDADLSYDLSFGVHWETPFTYGQRGQYNFFIIVHDYFTPNYPQGDETMLSLMALTPIASWSSESSGTDADSVYYCTDVQEGSAYTPGITLAGQVLQ